MNQFVPPAIIKALAREDSAEKADVAINVFAKPFQTSLAVLSLLAHSAARIGVIWLQYEPVGSKFDQLTPYFIGEYLREVLLFPTRIFQPDAWLGREPVRAEHLKDVNFRQQIRYQYAFENSTSRLLFLTHNDVFILRDIITPLMEGIEDNFAYGSLGQCWNCPAANAELMAEVMGQPPCSPENYLQVRPDWEQLLALYVLARKRNIFARPYEKDNFTGDFRGQPWPLPECRVNEWACMLNLEKTRPHCAPFGELPPPGAFGDCAGHNLDIGVPWFRAMHSLGMQAKHFDSSRYLRHWVGTGNKSQSRYAIAEDNALRLLNRHYPQYVRWLEKKTGREWRL